MSPLSGPGSFRPCSNAHRSCPPPSSQSFLDGASFRGKITKVPELKSSGCPRKCAAPAGFFAPAISFLQAGFNEMKR